mmetsp:Transcript_9649/g.18131  ORF Transcript_9649/g.18131 Transcript_9649/m.18131 type:complete len:455 (-) Transcript_9649:846-2210(-)
MIYIPPPTSLGRSGQISLRRIIVIHECFNVPLSYHHFNSSGALVVVEEDCNLLLALSRPVGHLVQSVTEEPLEDGPQPSRSCGPLVRLLGDDADGVVTHIQGGIVVGDHGGHLLQNGILGPLDHIPQLLLRERLQAGEHWKPPDEFWNQSVVDHVHVLHLLRNLAGRFHRVPYGHGSLVAVPLDVRPESNGGLADPLVDHLVDADKSPAADEKNVARVHLDVLHSRMLLVSLLRHVHDGALEHLQQGLLHTLPRHVSRGGGPGPLGNLVNLVDVHNAPLRQVEVVARSLEELAKDVLHVLAHVPSLSQGRRVREHERHVHQLGKRLGKKRLSRPGGSKHENVGLFRLDVLVEPRAEPPLDVGFIQGAFLLGRSTSFGLFRLLRGGIGVGSGVSCASKGRVSHGSQVTPIASTSASSSSVSAKASLSRVFAWGAPGVWQLDLAVLEERTAAATFT